MWYWLGMIHRYGAWLPVIEECPTDMALTMQCLRKSAAGKVSSLLLKLHTWTCLDGCSALNSSVDWYVIPQTIKVGSQFPWLKKDAISTAPYITFTVLSFVQAQSYCISQLFNRQLASLMYSLCVGWCQFSISWRFMKQNDINHKSLIPRGGCAESDREMWV